MRGFHELLLLDYILHSISHIEHDSYTFQIMIGKHIGYHIHIVLLSQTGQYLVKIVPHHPQVIKRVHSWEPLYY